MRPLRAAVAGVLCGSGMALGLASLAADAAEVNAARIVAATDDKADWLTHGRTYDEQRFSPLAQIHQGNVDGLELAWYFDLDTNRGQEATPLVIDGVMYVSTAWSKVFALDARTGRELWRFDPKVPGPKAVDACCDVVNRGVAAWGNRIFVGALDGRLIALDRATGQPAWSVQTTDPNKRYTITGAPRVVKGKVIIGNGGAELGVRGYVSAYDVDTGKMAWRFYTVPGNPRDGFESAALERAAKTWHGEWWKYGGGGTVWDAMAYDPQLDLLYIGVGNGSPWNHRIRSNGEGDNLFLSSIVALRPATGEYVWHFQTTPAESWDYTATQHIMLADLTIDGRVRRVLMQAPKNGFFYVLDRATGEFIHAKNYVNVSWTRGLDPKTGRPIPIAEARYLREPAMVAPGPFGAHNWYPMAFSPQTRLVYIPTLDASSYYKHDDGFEFSERTWNIGVIMEPGPANAKTVAATAKSKGASMLIAWDPVAQREVWRVNHRYAGNGGVLATGGKLLFQGASDGMFNAFAADSGARLWSYDVQNAIHGGPVTFELGGEQYVAAVAGIGGVAIVNGMAGNPPRSASGRVVAFKLNGKARLPALVPAVVRSGPDVRNAKAFGDVKAGQRNYERICSACHGPDARSTTAIPDLRFSNAIVDGDAFKAIVLDGARAAKGMVGFASELTPADAEAIRAYLVGMSAAM